ncbi:MAG: mechanosensitive ion channel domain-containing protein [Hyphomicrobiaceae bacterium]
MTNWIQKVALILLPFLTVITMAATAQDNLSSDHTEKQLGTPSAPAADPARKPPAGWGADIIASGAAAEIIEKHAPKIDRWSEQLKAAAKTIEGEWTGDEKLRKFPIELDKLRGELRAFIEDQKPQLKEAKDRLEKLGPAPQEGEPKEAEALAKQRNALAREVAARDGLTRQADAFLLEAAQNIEQSNTRRRERFAQNLLKPTPMIDSAFLWQRVPTEFMNHLSNTWKWTTTAIANTASQGLIHFLSMLVLPFVVFFSATKLVQNVWPQRSYDGQYLGQKPPRSARAYRAVTGMARSLIPWLLLLLSVYVLSRLFNYITDSNQRLLVITLVTLATAGLLIAMVRYSVRSTETSWNVIGRGTEKTRAIRWIGIGLIATWAVDQIITQSDQFLDAPYALTVTRGVVFSILYAVLILALLSRPLKPSATGAQAQLGGWPKPVFLIIASLATGIIVATLTGYISLARFIGAQFVTTGGIILLMFLVHMFAEYITSDQNGNGTQDANVSILRVTTGLFLDTAILLIGVPALLLQWGFDWTEVEGWIRNAFFGIQIGGLTISLQAILIALAILISGILLTRLVQRSFVRRTQRTGGMNQGVRDSIRTGLGYTGFILSVVAATSFLGIDFSNLAIVAGALSVGLGFGLQSIFNNFVSGLILLVERPIKIGDWITVGGEDGWVRKINVRATELETLNKESVIIPNSELISGTVKNWMYSDDLARITVPIGVSYNSDAEQVREVLLTIAKESPQLLSYPAPTVIFAGFGDSSLDFELRFFIANVNSRIQVASDVRFAIRKALCEQNIEIPFPQRDLHIRDLGDLNRAVKKERATAKGAIDEPPA